MNREDGEHVQDSKGWLIGVLIGLAATIISGIAGPVLNRDWMVESFWLDPASMIIWSVFLFSLGFTIGSIVMLLVGRKRRIRKIRKFTPEQKAMLQRLRKEGEIVNPTPGDRAVLEQLVSKGWAESEGYPNTGMTVWRYRR